MFSNLDFTRPWLALLILAIPLGYWLKKRFSGSHAAVIFSDLRLISVQGTWRTRTLFIPTVALALGWICMVIALMGPRLGHEETKITTEGIAISMVLDLSKSMEEEDMPFDGVKISRYEMVKRVFKDFVLGREDGQLSGRSNDLISLVVFGQYVDDLCPLTLDHDFLLDLMENYIDSVQTDIKKTEQEFQKLSPSQQRAFSQRFEQRSPIWQSTAIYEGVAMGADMLHNANQNLDVAKDQAQSQYSIKSKILILLSDGEDTGSTITIDDAIEVAKEFGVKVYSIAIHGQALQQSIAGLLLSQGKKDYNDAPMRSLAKETGGRFFEATDPESLLNIYETIDQLERTEISRQVSMDYAAWHHPWVLASFIFFCLHVLLRETQYRELP